ncbi:MAG: RNA polymerase sigma factor [Anaerolineae bacterium]
MSEPAAELVRCCQSGDAAAFARLVAETQNGVYNLAYSVLRDHQEAQDMMQEVYLRVWRALPGFRADSKFSTWLYRIVVNACLNRRRSLRPALAIVDDPEIIERISAPRADPVAATLLRERREELWAAVGRLPEKYRLVIVLFYQQELPYSDIARLLSLPLGTVKAHLNRARQALACALGARQEELGDTM